MLVLSAIALAFYLVLLVEGTLADNFTLVLVALIGAIASVINTYILTRERDERKQHRANVRKAIEDGGLVAMVPEQIVKEVENAEEPNDSTNSSTQPDATPIDKPGT